MYTKFETTLLATTTTTVACASFMGALFILVTYFKYKELRTNLFLHLVASLSACDLMQSIGYTMSRMYNVNAVDASDPPAICYIQALIAQGFGICSFGYVICLSHALYSVAVRMDLNTDRYLYRYHGITWTCSLALSLAIIPGVGPATDWCWVVSGNWLRLTFYIPLIFALGIVIFTYVMGKRALRKEGRQSLMTVTTRAREKTLTDRMLLMLVAFVFCWTGGAVHRLLQLFMPLPPFPIAYWQGLTTPMQGLLDAIIYSRSTMLREFLGETRCFRWCKPKPEELVAEASNLHKATSVSGARGRTVGGVPRSYLSAQGSRAALASPDGSGGSRASTSPSGSSPRQPSLGVVRVLSGSDT